MARLNVVIDKYLSDRGKIFYHSIRFAQTPHLLTCGASGSGKTFLNKLIVAKCALTVPNCKITVLDFKASDYRFARGSERLYEFNNVIDGLNEFYAEFEKRLNGEVEDNSLRLLLVEELASMLAYYDKKTSQDMLAKIGTMIFMGRSFGVHLVLSTQRPDSTLFASGTRDSLSVIALGNLSKEGKAMLFSGFDLTEKHGIGTGYMLLNGADLYSIRVPQVNNVRKLEHYIRLGLNR